MKALDPIMRSSSSSGITCIDKVQNMEIGIPSSEKVISDTLLFNSPTLELLNGIGPDGGVDIMVWWDEPVDEDTANPLNWSSTKKWTNICTPQSPMRTLGTSGIADNNRGAHSSGQASSLN